MELNKNQDDGSAALASLCSNAHATPNGDSHAPPELGVAQSAVRSAVQSQIDGGREDALIPLPHPLPARDHGSALCGPGPETATAKPRTGDTATEARPPKRQDDDVSTSAGAKRKRRSVLKTRELKNLGMPATRIASLRAKCPTAECVVCGSTLGPVYLGETQVLFLCGAQGCNFPIKQQQMAEYIVEVSAEWVEGKDAR